MSTILPLEAEGLAFEAGGRRLIDGVSFTLDAGTRTVILGPNGAGKTLLLRLCHGLLAPTGGRLGWRGGAARPETRQAMVFQQPVMLRRSAVANLDYVLASRGIARAERARRAEDALGRTGLGHLARTPARVLSAGERQRLALARAWIVEPEVIFLDEPTASLDPAASRAVEDIVCAIHEAGTKVVLTTHDLGQARRLAHDVLFMHHGRILERGPAAAFFERPRTPEARATDERTKSRMPKLRAILGAALALMVAATPAAAAERFITLASTTSTENSGLFDAILPAFTKATGIAVRVVAVGTGAALRLGRRGDVDVVLVHARGAELRYVADGHAIARRDVMHNDFIIAGPDADPARVRGMKDVVAALRRIARAKAPFASRGDDSGTHRAERRYWKAAAVDPRTASGTWYLEAGAGMGATLNLAVAKNAYVLSDRATWLSFKNRAGLSIAVEGDPRLFNPYGVMLVNPARHGHVKRADGMRFIEWLTSDAGRAAIAGFRLVGRQVFFPSKRP
jgi:tungstate transport system substrate-binding protein